jgi:hypothetical protein
MDGSPAGRKEKREKPGRQQGIVLTKLREERNVQQKTVTGGEGFEVGKDKSFLPRKDVAKILLAAGRTVTGCASLLYFRIFESLLFNCL